MKKEHKDTIINMVNEIGISNTLDIIGGDKDIIRKVYIDYPESYLDYLIGNLYPMKDTYGLNRLVYEYKDNILHYEDSTDTILIDDYIWNYFYKSVMQFDDRTIESIFTKWLYKHYPKLSERKPIPYTDWWEIDKQIKGLGDTLFNLSKVPKDYFD